MVVRPSFRGLSGEFVEIKNDAPVSYSCSWGAHAGRCARHAGAHWLRDQVYDVKLVRFGGLLIKSDAPEGARANNMMHVWMLGRWKVCVDVGPVESVCG